jgi:predicted transcriptional regulator of viral defense system
MDIVVECQDSTLCVRTQEFSLEWRDTPANRQVAIVDGVTVRISSPAKTVADCFKYRHKIGLDVAIEALRECHHQRML